eukprot:scaffold47268_cov62-Phaeocystis_antarctica.AAC.2
MNRHAAQCEITKRRKKKCSDRVVYVRESQQLEQAYARAGARVASDLSPRQRHQHVEWPPPAQVARGHLLGMANQPAIHDDAGAQVGNHVEQEPCRQQRVVRRPLRVHPQEGHAQWLRDGYPKHEPQDSQVPHTAQARLWVEQRSDIFLLKVSASEPTAFATPFVAAALATASEPTALATPFVATALAAASEPAALATPFVATALAAASEPNLFVPNTESLFPSCTACLSSAGMASSDFRDADFARPDSDAESSTCSILSVRDCSAR